MDNVTRLLMQGAAGATGGATYVDDVFSTYLYYGNCPDNNLNTTQTITNGIDLAGEGGLVWTKARDTATAHNLIDTVRGNTQRIRTSSDGSSTTITDAISAFNDNGYGFRINHHTGTGNQVGGDTYLSIDKIDKSAGTPTATIAAFSETNTGSLFSISDDTGSTKFQVNSTGVVDAKLNSGALGLPVGTSSERPLDASAGYIRWNSTNGAVEVYTGNEWTEMISEYFPTGSTTFSAHF